MISIKKETALIAINLGVKIGSIYEAKNEKGISHFIEHMLFKGTKNRTNKVLNDELEQLGGEYNAYTEYSSTVYNITSLKEEAESAIELLSDMVINSNFPKAEMEKEREVILSELRSSRDDIEELSFIKINNYGFNRSPLKYEIIGEEKRVKSLKREDLIEFYNRWYVPSNCCISIASSMEHDEVIELVERYFSTWVDKKVSHPEVIIEDNKPLTKRSYKNDIEQGSILYLYTFHNLTKKEELALKILEHRLGSSNNSILFREVRENRGLAYEIYSEMNTSKAIKTLYIYTTTNKENINEAMGTIDECIKKINNREIMFNKKTIDIMKKILKTAVVSTLEDVTDISNYVLHQALDNEELYQFVDDMKDIENIDAEDIYNVGIKVFKNPTIHILLPKERDEDE